MYLDIALLAGCALLFSAVAGLVDRSWLSGPIIFIVFGFAIGPLGFGWLSFDVNADTLKIMAELTLALVLFIDAAAADLSVLRRFSRIPIRMLLIGLPLTLLMGFGAGVWFFNDFSLLEVAILATLLAPTDAALGQAVVKHEAVPSEIKQGLNAESGLNDGICVPVLLLFLALAADAMGHTSGHGNGEHLGLILLAEELGIGLLVAVTMVGFSAWLLRMAIPRHWVTHISMNIPVIALAISCFATAQFVGGSGFIAAFCGGLLFGHLMKEQRDDLLHAAESTGELFAMVTWVLFGAAVLGHSIGFLNWTMLIYALLSLTVLRMLPIFLSLIGSGVSTEGKLFLGWFGPRGLASVVFAVIVLGADLPHGDTIITVTAVTVILSIVLHGITATPWANRWSRGDEK